MATPEQMYVTGDTKLAAARAFVEANKKGKGGVVCPCCKSVRIVKRYRLSRPIVETLCRLRYKCRQTGGSVHVLDFAPVASRGYHPCVLLFHRLIAKDGQDEGKPFNRSGRYYVTELGERWLDGKNVKGRVRSYVMVEDHKRIGRSDTPVTVEDVLLVPYDPHSAYDVPPKKTKKKKPKKK